MIMLVKGVFLLISWGRPQAGRDKQAKPGRTEGHHACTTLAAVQGSNQVLEFGAYLHRIRYRIGNHTNQ